MAYKITNGADSTPSGPGFEHPVEDTVVFFINLCIKAVALTVAIAFCVGVPLVLITIVIASVKAVCACLRP
jgi:hypothetical protein